MTAESLPGGGSEAPAAAAENSSNSGQGAADHVAKPDRLKPLRAFFLNPEPPWIVPHGLAALFVSAVVSLAVLLGQFMIDRDRDRQNERLQTELQKDNQSLQAAIARDTLRTENLRFVREHSSSITSAEAARLPFEGFDLRGEDLAFLNLPRANFARALLTNTRLLGAHLEGANLLFADLEGAEASDAKLGSTITLASGQTVTVAPVNLMGAELTCADLSAADLTGARLNGATLTDADLSGAKLTGATFNDQGQVAEEGAPDVLVAPKAANLTRADLADADLRAANLTGANLTDVYFNSQTQWPDGHPPPGVHSRATERTDSADNCRKKWSALLEPLPDRP